MTWKIAPLFPDIKFSTEKVCHFYEKRKPEIDSQKTKHSPSYYTKLLSTVRVLGGCHKILLKQVANDTKSFKNKPLLGNLENELSHKKCFQTQKQRKEKYISNTCNAITTDQEAQWLQAFDLTKSFKEWQLWFYWGNYSTATKKIIGCHKEN